ncbi:hypothetical protein FHP25_32160 [Vineibacter terrae]|uniref:DUF5615 domain-containing protein n=1 Tax=Vineibacter terrae TaxID=2586908 RepID=A0A5C8PC88_9HYPH|nr:hypothetical protein FHP25_32160 [Vineibacter terrae]
MKLLFDHNLSPALPRRLAEVFPGSMHVAAIGLTHASDEVGLPSERHNAASTSVLAKSCPTKSSGMLRI